MSSLEARVQDYAQRHGVEIILVDMGPGFSRHFTARAGPLTLLFLDAATAAGPDYGEMVYQACERIQAARHLVIYQRPRAKPLLAS